MVIMSHGRRAGSRRKMRKSPRDRGKVPVTRYLQEFSVGDKVAIQIEPTAYDGAPHHRFHGRVGDVTGKQGNAYKVSIKDGGKSKVILTRPVHLKKVK